MCEDGDYEPSMKMAKKYIKDGNVYPPKIPNIMRKFPKTFKDDEPDEETKMHRWKMANDPEYVKQRKQALEQFRSKVEELIEVMTLINEQYEIESTVIASLLQKPDLLEKLRIKPYMFQDEHFKGFMEYVLDQGKVDLNEIYLKSIKDKEFLNNDVIGQLYKTDFIVTDSSRDTNKIYYRIIKSLKQTNLLMILNNPLHQKHLMKWWNNLKI